MKHKKLIFILIAEAALLILLCCLLRKGSGLDASVLVSPFSLPAQGLAALARGGTVGAGLAAALWFGLSLLPAASTLRSGNQTMRLPERLARWFLTVTLAVDLYGMACPTQIWPLAAGNGDEAVQVVRFGLGAAIWSAVILCFVLYIIRRFRTGGWDGLLQSAGVLGGLVCVLLTATVTLKLFDCVTTLTETKQAGLLAAVETDVFAELPGTEERKLDIPVLLLRYAIQIIPMLLNIAVLLRGMELLDAMRKKDEASIVPAAERLSRVCCLTLGLSAALPAGFNLVQIFLARSLRNIDVNAEFSLTGLILTVLVLLFARLVIENKKLKDDNSLFI